ncbi:hypothetical protein FQA39_LY14804 [Lamprigera yunnana]|nr:hypothetical protein FQA39_LY14804 [Lamprigera yunnana]
MSLVPICIFVPLLFASPIYADFDFNNEIEVGTLGPFAIIVINIKKRLQHNANDYDSIMTKCSFNGGFASLINCAAPRALKMIHQVAKSESIPLFSGVTLINDNKVSEREGKSVKMEDLPQDPLKKSEVLFDLVINSVVKFFSGRSLKINIPNIESVDVARVLEEGRAKSKKGLSPLFMGIAAKLLLIKSLAIVVLKFMSIKALILAKVALVIAGILAAQNLFGKNTGIVPYFGGHSWGSGWSGASGPSYGVPSWTTNSIGGWTNAQYPYARSFKDDRVDTQTEAQDLAYSKQKS